MATEKIIGYFLLLVGIVTIVAGTFSLYQVFTGDRKAPRLFHVKMPAISLPGQQSLQLELPEGMSLPDGLSLPKNIASPQQDSSEMKLLPDELVNDLTNMSLYFLLMGFVVSSGAKVASISVKLIKDIKVEVKEEKLKPVTEKLS
ncbi:MAG TPA: hypothetical protein VMW41_01835 [Candidatus Bathyarchaeia archaeon]|nr:hypothetical protein [Candidatus Bathyarchaeia archaeon]